LEGSEKVTYPNLIIDFSIGAVFLILVAVLFWGQVKDNRARLHLSELAKACSGRYRYDSEEKPRHASRVEGVWDGALFTCQVQDRSATLFGYWFGGMAMSIAVCSPNNMCLIHCENKTEALGGQFARAPDLGIPAFDKNGCVSLRQPMSLLFDMDSKGLIHSEEFPFLIGDKFRETAKQLLSHRDVLQRYNDIVEAYRTFLDKSRIDVPRITVVCLSKTAVKITSPAQLQIADLNIAEIKTIVTALVRFAEALPQTSLAPLVTRPKSILGRILRSLGWNGE
jgi:hypothetical protein